MVIDVQVLTPDRVICTTIADVVVLPGLTGQIGVLNGHAALIASLDTGLLRIKLDQKWTPIIVCGGLVEVSKDVVTVLVNDVEELFSVELNEATNELKRATSALESVENSKDRIEASIELKKAVARLEAIDYLT
jgi:F-type H+-transporting ATPase subunit epsilon